MQAAPPTGRTITADNDKNKGVNRNSSDGRGAGEERIEFNRSVHSQQPGYVNKLDVRAPHVLTEIHLTERINVCHLL